MMRDPKSVIQELTRRSDAGDESVLDELVTENMVNHAAGPQGRDGLKLILSTIAVDLGPGVTVDQHHLIADGELVAQHLTLRGSHVSSTMPLLAGTRPAGQEVSWTFIHLWRVVDGMVVEHWACRDDVGLLHQVGAWPPPSR